MKFKSVSKKLRLAALLLIAGSAAAFAQTGEKTLGVAGGFASHNNGGYMDLYFQYTVAPNVRIAPEIGYVFRNEGESAFIFSTDVHFPFRLAKGFNIYPLVGFTLNSWNPEHHDNYTRVGADFGGGFDFYLTRNLKLTLQGKYSLMDDCSGGFIGAGFGYIF